MRNIIKRTKALLIAIFAITALATITSLPISKAAGSATSETVNLYKSKCAMCHGADGSGNTVNGKKLNCKDLRSTEVQKMSDAQIREVIAKGKNKMPGYEQQLGKEKVNNLAAYMREVGK